MTVDLFIESIRSPKTKEVYANLLRAFAAKVGIADVGLLDAEEIQTKLIEYVVALKNAGRSSSRASRRGCCHQLARWP